MDYQDVLQFIVFGLNDVITRADLALAPDGITISMMAGQSSE